MAKIFLDTNILIRLMEDDLSFETKEKINKHNANLSVLSIHIAAYIHKIKIPSEQFNTLLSHFNIISFNNSVAQKCLEGPTSDFEDNVQLYTAAVNKIKTFITLDKKLLKMKTYKTVKIISPQEL